MIGLMVVICQVSLFIIFVWRYDLRKPWFIIVLWTLVVVMVLLSILNTEIIFRFNHLNYATHPEEKDRLYSLSILVIDLN